MKAYFSTGSGTKHLYIHTHTWNYTILEMQTVKEHTVSLQTTEYLDQGQRDWYINVLTLGKKSMNSAENNRLKSTAAICLSSSPIAALWTELRRNVTLDSTGRLLYASCKPMHIYVIFMQLTTVILYIFSDQVSWLFLQDNPWVMNIPRAPWQHEVDANV